MSSGKHLRVEIHSINALRHIQHPASGPARCCYGKNRAVNSGVSCMSVYDSICPQSVCSGLLSWSACGRELILAVWE